MRFTFGALSIVFALLSFVAFMSTLSYLLDRSALFEFYSATYADPAVYESPAIDGAIATQAAMAVRLNPSEAAFWLHHSNYFESIPCSETRAICEQRVNWLSNAIALRPIFDRAWSRLVAAQLAVGNVEGARVALRNARHFAPFEYHTNFAILSFGVAQWELLSEADQQMVVDALERLFAETKLRFVRDTTGAANQTAIDNIALSSPISDELAAARAKRVKQLQRNLSE